MLIEEVKKLSPVDRLVYWVSERRKISIRRAAGLPFPWTDDEILRDYWFTEIRREDDKTTRWLRENFREPMRNDPRVLQGCATYRWFNKINTGKMLLDAGLLHKWDSGKALPLLRKLGNEGVVFTAAYIISTRSFNRMPKVEGVCRSIDAALEKGVKLPANCSLQRATELIKEQCINVGKFMAYELVCDLRHTYLLENAPDILTWCNPGPGCVRGLRRLQGEEVKPVFRAGREKAGWMNSQPEPRPGDMQKIRDLIPLIKKRLNISMEMRDAEGLGCEFDKYERVLWGQGTAKKYTPGGSRSAIDRQWLKEDL